MGLLRDDGKRPDGLILVTWQNGRCLTWNTTAVDTLATSYLASTSSHTGSAAEAAAIRKKTKYAAITRTHIFVPVAVETVGPIDVDGLNFLN